MIINVGPFGLDFILFAAFLATGSENDGNLSSMMADADVMVVAEKLDSRLHLQVFSYFHVKAVKPRGSLETKRDERVLGNGIILYNEVFLISS